MTRRPLLALASCSLLAFAFVSCGDDDSDDSPGSSDTGTPAGSSPVVSLDGSKEPTLTGPASKYALNIEDMGTDASTGNAAYMTDLPATMALDAKTYGKVQFVFPSATEGESTLKKWGYLGGYETFLIPEGRNTAVLTGRYNVGIEIHLFETPAGAKQAYDHFQTLFPKSAAKPQKIGSDVAGNESTIWTATSGKVGNSSVNQVLHEVVMRRGNMVALVITSGAEGFMKVDTVKSLANIIDQKAMGARAAIEPTPIPTPAATATKAP